LPALFLTAVTAWHVPKPHPGLKVLLSWPSACLFPCPVLSLQLLFYFCVSSLLVVRSSLLCSCLSLSASEACNLFLVLIEILLYKQKDTHTHLLLPRCRQRFLLKRRGDPRGEARQGLTNTQHRLATLSQSFGRLLFE